MPKIRSWPVLLVGLAVVGPVHGQTTFLDTFGTGGAGNGQFAQPLGLAVGPDGRLYIADSFNSRIQVFSQAPTSVGWSYAAQFGSAGAGPIQFNLPTDVAVSAAGTVYVADANNNRVQFFNAAGVYQGEFGTFGTGNGRLDGPSSVAVSAAGTVLVADTGNNRVQAFSATGTYQSQFANAGGAAQQVSQPAGVAVAADGTRYVADTSGNRVQAYNPDGSFKLTLGSGQLSVPTDLAVAPSGDVYVADSGNGRVRVYSSMGTFKFDLGVGTLNNPSDVTVAPTGQIFVSDTLNNRVARWFNPAEWVSGFNTFATPTAGAGQLLGQSLTLNPGMTLNSLSALTVQSGGSLTLNGGVLNSTGTAAVAGTLTVRSGSTATSTGLVTVQPGGLLNGNGTLAAPVRVEGTIRPGETGPATLRTGDLTLAPGGTYAWSIGKAVGTAGTDWSLLAQSASNSLSVAATPGSPFTIRVDSVGSLPDFDPNVSYTWTIAQYQSVAGFSPDKFTLDTTGFANPTGGGAFAVGLQGSNLVLTFTPVPEPAQLLALAVAGLIFVRRIRR